MNSLTLVIANKNYSSWSMRPWLSLKMAGIPFEEIVVPLAEDDTASRIARHSPSGKVPLLKDGDLAIWESLAIIEYLHERYPDAAIWPRAPQARAVARAVSAEMHAGFAALRSQLPMNVRATRPPVPLSAEVVGDVGRIRALWQDCRARFGEGGPFLFGSFCAADAMYAPVVTRFRTYGVELDAAARDYCDAILALPAVREWFEAAAAEPWSIDKYDSA